MANNRPTLPAPLALRPKDAAALLGIGQRKLWDLSQPRGPVPCVRVGCCVLYPYHLLQAWLADQAAASAQTPHTPATAGPEARDDAGGGNGGDA